MRLPVGDVHPSWTACSALTWLCIWLSAASWAAHLQAEASEACRHESLIRCRRAGIMLPDTFADRPARMQVVEDSSVPRMMDDCCIMTALLLACLLLGSDCRQASAITATVASCSAPTRWRSNCMSRCSCRRACQSITESWHGQAGSRQLLSSTARHSYTMMTACSAYATQMRKKLMATG